VKQHEQTLTARLGLAKYSWNPEFRGGNMSRVFVLLSLLLFSLSGMASDSWRAVADATQASKQDSELEWFRSTEQSLMDAIASGDKTLWDRVMDRDCVVTTEEGEVLTKEEFLKELRGLPPGLTGKIFVKDLTLQKFAEFAVVRARLEEQENVYGQQLFTQYRVTDTFRREGQTWKLLASHFSVVTLDPPPQEVSKAEWPALAGAYKLLPDGWTFHVQLQDGVLYGGRDPSKLRPFIPLAPNVFTLKGALGEWIFVMESGKPAAKVVHLRKFEPLVWTRVEESK
jgi:uncharacterized protein DUF4440